MKPVWDVAVVGAGPAGANAALHLARAGARVVVFDRERHPRYKTCGGGLVRRAARELPFDPPGRALRAAEMHAPAAGVAVRIERDEPLLWMTMRADLDARLLGAAEEAGAEVRTPCAVEGLERTRDRLRLATADGALEARLVFAADGALSRIAKAAGFGPPALAAPALEWELAVSDDLLERYGDAGRFDFDCVSDGYGWVFPKDGGLSVGVLSTVPGGPGAKGLAGRLRAYLAGLGLDRPRSVERHGFLIPLAPRPGPPARGPVLLLGDAYGLCDPLTAEGISPALISGRLAAEAALGAEFGAVEAARRYRRTLGQALLADFAVARRLAAVIYRRPRWRRRLFRAFGPKMCAAMAAQIEGARSYRQLLLDPRSYGRLLFGRAPAEAVSPPRPTASA